MPDYTSIKTNPQRFWNKVKIGSDGECWLWIGARSSNGYGAFFCQGKTLGAHRVSWFLSYGTIPDGLSVLHKCDNPQCVNPSHLFLGTQLDNIKDQHNKGRNRSQTGEKHGSAIWNTEQVLRMRELYDSGKFNCTEIAIMFNGSLKGVWTIVKRKTWKHLP